MAKERKTDIGLKPEESQVVARDFNLFSNQKKFSQQKKCKLN